MSRVFARIKGDLSANVSPQETTLQEIEEALARMEVAAAAATEEPLLSPQSPCWTAAHLPAANKADTLVLQLPGQHIVAEAATTNMPRGAMTTAMSSVSPTQLALPVANKADVLALQSPEQNVVAEAAATNTPSGATTTTTTSVTPAQLALDSLFTTPPMAVIPTPPPTRKVAIGRRIKLRKQYNTSAKRRSAHIANQPALPTMERCQRVLFKRMGWLPGGDDVASMEKVLAQYVAMFKGPLPQHTITALTAVFGIDIEDDDNPTDALVEMVGEGVDEAAAEVEEIIA